MLYSGYWLRWVSIESCFKMQIFTGSPIYLLGSFGKHFPEVDEGGKNHSLHKQTFVLHGLMV